MRQSVAADSSGTSARRIASEGTEPTRLGGRLALEISQRLDRKAPSRHNLDVLVTTQEGAEVDDPVAATA